MVASMTAAVSDARLRAEEACARAEIDRMIAPVADRVGHQLADEEHDHLAIRPRYDHLQELIGGPARVAHAGGRAGQAPGAAGPAGPVVSRRMHRTGRPSGRPRTRRPAPGRRLGSW